MSDQEVAAVSSLGRLAYTCAHETGQIERRTVDNDTSFVYLLQFCEPNHQPPKYPRVYFVQFSNQIRDSEHHVIDLIHFCTISRGKYKAPESTPIFLKHRG